MQKVLTAEEMREIDRLTTEKYGIPSLLLMENAAHAAARVITEKLGGSVEGKSVLVLCGKGNNGGDGAALARILWTQGAKLKVLLLGKIEDTKGDARVNFEIVKNLQMQQYPIEFNQFETTIEINKWWKYCREELKIDVIVDAVFGTGVNRPLKKLAESFIDSARDYTIDKYPALLVSIDLPSGVNADLANPIGFNLDSDLTITFTSPKIANVIPPICHDNGELYIENIGSPKDLINNAKSKLYVSERQDAIDWLWSTKVQSNSYKKSRGTALIIGGSENYSGAAVLASNGCFAAGAGMVTAVVPKSVKEIVAAKTSDEIIVKTLEKTEVLAEEVDVMAIGCGLANDKITHKFIRQTIENQTTPMVLDAEALNALSPFDLQGSDEFPLILTPHVGEMSRLVGREVLGDKIALVREFAEKHNVILILKGERSLIAKPDGTVVINPTGNAGVSRAGAGDTLTGTITSFLAQTFAVKETNIENAFEAVVAALYIAGLAGDIAAEKHSERLLTATDVRQCLQSAIASLGMRVE